MIFLKTKLKGACIIELNRLEDERGFFGRSYCELDFEEQGLTSRIVQTNISHNKKKGTLRGMHMQAVPFEESKLVRCTRGAIFDVIIDLRPASSTFKQWLGIMLTAESYRMLYVPEGCAHGFITLVDRTDVAYQVSQYYTPGAERGYRWDDPAFNIKWPVIPEIISERDRSHLLFEDSLPV